MPAAGEKKRRELAFKNKQSVVAPPMPLAATVEKPIAAQVAKKQRTNAEVIQKILELERAFQQRGREQGISEPNLAGQDHLGAADILGTQQFQEQLTEARAADDLEREVAQLKVQEDKYSGTFAGEKVGNAWRDKKKKGLLNRPAIKKDPQPQDPNFEED